MAAILECPSCSFSHRSDSWVGMAGIASGRLFSPFFPIQSLHIAASGFLTACRAQCGKGSYMVLGFPQSKSFKIRRQKLRVLLRVRSRTGKASLLAYSVGHSNQRLAQIQRTL